MLTFFRAALAALLLTAMPSLIVAAYDDVEPEVSARVARISFMRGEVKVRRNGEEEWETATLNLPLVEGDELTTGSDSRAEVQFAANTHLRVDRDAYIQIKQLSDQGVAVSVSAGSVAARLRKFDGEAEFFEIDAPGTTVSVQKEGAYRVDAGEPGGQEVRVAVTKGGEARIYSISSGFQLRSGRAGTVVIEGDRAGEWEMADAARFDDEFDHWVGERDELIAKRLASASYGSYYDQDIYGAEELNDNGAWEYTRDYGYIWRPHAWAISAYQNWSPYRYGSWRWLSPFGWTWVNDEPWGWATYHHGRWIWYRNRWVWTPYGYYRTNRSWWYPALVVIRIVDRNICWYPLGYRNRYHSYNNGYHDWVGNRDRRRPPRGDDQTPRGDRPPATQPRPPREREPIEVLPGADTISVKKPDSIMVEPAIPVTGVVSVSAENFGVTRRSASTAPADVARAALRRAAAGDATSIELPDPRSTRARPNREFTAQPPQVVSKAVGPTRTGAGERRRDVPLDRELMRARILGDRPPVTLTPQRPIEQGGRELPRRTGLVGRPTPPKREIVTSPIDRVPGKEAVDGKPGNSLPPNGTPRPKEDLPTFEAAPRRDRPKPRDISPRTDPPPRRDLPAPREDAPVPRAEPRPRRDPPAPRVEPPRANPPPKREPAPKSDSPRPAPVKPYGGRKQAPID